MSRGMSRLADTIDRVIAKHGAAVPAAHSALLKWYDEKWPDPRSGPDVLRVPPETFAAVLDGLTPNFRFCDARIVEAGHPTVRLRPLGCRTSLVMDPKVAEPTEDTIANVVASAERA